MERMWAPWRGDYVTGGSEQEDGCLFCRKGAPGDDEARQVLKRGEHCFILLNRYPYNVGHLMIAPYRHVAELDGLNPEELREILILTQEGIAALKSVMAPQGFNVGFNLGSCAGAGIADHLHLHVVPRWAGDTNYMPVLAGTRVMPQSLEDVFSQLKERFQPCEPRQSDES